MASFCIDDVRSCAKLPLGQSGQPYRIILLPCVISCKGFEAPDADLSRIRSPRAEASGGRVIYVGSCQIKTSPADPVWVSWERRFVKVFPRSWRGPLQKSNSEEARLQAAAWFTYEAAKLQRHLRILSGDHERSPIHPILLRIVTRTPSLIWIPKGEALGGRVIYIGSCPITTPLARRQRGWGKTPGFLKENQWFCICQSCIPSFAQHQMLTHCWQGRQPASQPTSQQARTQLEPIDSNCETAPFPRTPGSQLASQPARTQLKAIDSNCEPVPLRRTPASQQASQPASRPEIETNWR